MAAEFYGGVALVMLLKSLEGHVIDDVKFKHVGEWVHVRISATELDPKYALHETLGSKTLAFSIADEGTDEIILKRVAAVLPKRVGIQMKIEVSFDEYHCTRCKRKAFKVFYEPYRFICKSCGRAMLPDDLRASAKEAS